MAIPDITSLYNTPDIQQAQQQSQQAATTASNYQSAAAQLPAALKKAIEEKVNYNKDIIDAQAKAQANYFAAPATARSDYQDIFNPFDREKLVAQATANAYAPYQSLTQILGQRQGNIADIVQQGTGAFNSAVGAEQNNAQLARQNFQDLLGNADRLANAQEWMYSAGHQGGSGSIAEQQALTALEKDVANGATYADLLPRYSQVLPAYQIRQIYNEGQSTRPNGGYGPAKETPQQENKLLQGLPGLSGATAAKTTGQMTVTPITSTSKGKTATTGWKLKKSDGSTATIYPGATIGGIFGLGGKSATEGLDAQKMIEEYKNAGATDEQILDRLKAAGFIVQ